MIKPSRFSIRTLTDRLQNPAPKRKQICLHLVHVSQLIKDTTGSGVSYTDSHYECAKQKRRLSSRRRCINCNMYNPLKNKADELNG